MPEGGVTNLAHGDVMRYEDIICLCRALSDLGVRKIRFTGGEPLVRKGFVPFLA
jgi:cyclic pyranopterin phosphate synthase